MKLNKKTAVVLSLALTIVLIAGVMSSIAADPLTSQDKTIREQVEANVLTEPRVLVQIGTAEITNKELEDYKAYLSVGSNLELNDSQLLEEMVTQELFLQLAKERGVYVSLEEGKRAAVRLREVLQQQSTEVQETHKKIMESMNMDEETYWNNFAPPQYQEMLSIQNLTEKLIDEKVIKNESLGKEIREYKQKLFESAVAKKEVRFLYGAE